MNTTNGCISKYCHLNMAPLHRSITVTGLVQVLTLCNSVLESCTELAKILKVLLLERVGTHEVTG